MRASPLPLAVLASLLLACPSDPGSGTEDAASGADAGLSDAPSACACTAEEFCCLDHCQPLGTSCGSGPDAGSDAPIDPCTVPRARPDGTGDAAQTALCLGSEVLDCTAHRTYACNSSYPLCESFFDAPRGVWGASCFEEGTTACSESDPVLRCDGSTLVSCSANINYPASGPPYLQRRASCPEFYGPEAVCVSDGSAGPRCDIPSAPACDEATHRLECTTDLGGALICGSLGRVVTLPCGPDARCLDNASTRAAGGVQCIPSDATPSAHGPSVDRAYLRCESSMQIRVEQHGFEWTEGCDPTLVFVSDGAGGFREEYRDQVCYAGAGGVRCEQVGTEHCDPATFPTTCDPDGMSSRSCEVDEIQVRRCNVFGLDYPCDATTGLCAAIEPCNPRFPFTSRCVLGGAYHTVCHPTEGFAIPEPCTGCVEEAGGTTRCE